MIIIGILRAEIVKKDKELKEKDIELKKKDDIIKEKEVIIEVLKIRSKPHNLDLYRSRFNA